MIESEYITVKEFVRRVPFKEKTVRRRLKNGDLPAYQPGGPGTSWQIDWTEYCRRACNGVKTPATHDEASESDHSPTQGDVKPSGPTPRWKEMFQ